MRIAETDKFRFDDIEIGTGDEDLAFLLQHAVVEFLLATPTAIDLGL